MEEHLKSSPLSTSLWAVGNKELEIKKLVRKSYPNWYAYYIQKKYEKTPYPDPNQKTIEKYKGQNKQPRRDSNHSLSERVRYARDLQELQNQETNISHKPNLYYEISWLKKPSQRF